MQKSLETTLAKLISIPSITSDAISCNTILEYVRSELEPFGLFIHGDSSVSHPWFIATTKKTKQPAILLAAHLDVVPGLPELFTMQFREDKIYGRGVYDMKFAVACYIEFVKTHSQKLHDMNIGFLFTTDEEAGGACTATILAEGWRPQVVFLPDGGDNWHIEEQAKGLYVVQLIARGIAAHGSRPWEGDNALHRLMEVLAILRQSFPSLDTTASTLTVNEFHSGEAANQIPDYAMASIDFRSFSKEELALYKTQINQLVRKHQLELKVVQDGAPLLFDKKNPLVRTFLDALRQQTAAPVHYCQSYGASDARYFAQYDIPCIIIEPHGGGRHSAKEWLQTEDLQVYYALIERWVLMTLSQQS